MASSTGRNNHFSNYTLVTAKFQNNFAKILGTAQLSLWRWYATEKSGSGYYGPGGNKTMIACHDRTCILSRGFFSSVFALRPESRLDSIHNPADGLNIGF